MKDPSEMIATPPYPRELEARLELQQSELFVVRVWRPIAGGFRASVRGIDDEAARQFSQPGQVVRFLHQTIKGSR